MGWNPANILLNCHDPALREIQDRIVEALRDLANTAGQRGARAIASSCSAATTAATEVP